MKDNDTHYFKMSKCSKYLGSMGELKKIEISQEHALVKTHKMSIYEYGFYHYCDFQYHL